MVSRYFWDIDTKVDGKLPVKVLSQAWDIRRARRVIAAHLKFYDVGKSFRRGAIERPTTYRKAVAL